MDILNKVCPPCHLQQKVQRLSNSDVLKIIFPFTRYLVEGKISIFHVFNDMFILKFPAVQFFHEGFDKNKKRETFLLKEVAWVDRLAFLKLKLAQNVQKRKAKMYILICQEDASKKHHVSNVKAFLSLSFLIIHVRKGY